jgi:hypothetical protein
MSLFCVDLMWNDPVTIRIITGGRVTKEIICIRIKMGIAIRIGIGFTITVGVTI